MTSKRYTVRSLALLVFCGLVLFAGRAAACMVCIPFPEDTATDLLQRAEVVVLARENPDKPFSYLAREVLKGELGQPAIDLFVDSRTRRRLALYPEQAMVLARGGTTGTWQVLGYATPAYEDIVRKILARAPAWRNPEMRARFFMPYLAHEEQALHELAYLEVGRASYDTIREADVYVPSERLYRFLSDRLYLEWRALYILLLGIDANPDEANAIRTSIADMAQLNQKLNLSAWATALIEVDGVAAIEWLERHYLGWRERDPETVEEIVKALSVQGTSRRSQLRGRIAESYAVLIDTHPYLAGWAARDLAAWKDWRLADALAELRKSGSPLDSASAYAIDYYVGRARSSTSN